MIRVLDLPGVEAIEARLRLNALTATREDRELDEMVEALITKTLSVEGDPRKLIWDTIYYGLTDQGQPHEIAQYEANNRKRWTIEQWRTHGWDIVGDDGHAILCFSLIEDALLCLTAGVEGRQKIELEQLVWVAKKEADTVATPQDKRRNESFLNLGQRKRSRG